MTVSALPIALFRLKLTMEPHLVTAPEHLAELAELMAREPIFHRPELGTTRADYERMIDPAFWEVGASGRRYGREYALEILEERSRNPAEERWETRDFHCLEIARDHFLLTYTLLQGERVTRRSTLWRRTEEGWKILYHQGTIVLDG
jgi:hypothetical protein